MNNRKWWKALLGSVFVLCLFVVANMSTDAAAGKVTENSGVVIQEYTDIGSYRVEGEFTAPGAPDDYPGYVFAGWYTNADLAIKNALSSEVTSTEIDAATTYYAKFVPKEILGVRVQVSADTTYAKDKTNVRFITTVDSGNYNAVGFDVEHNGKKYNGQSNTVYKQLYVVDKEGTILDNYSPMNVFHKMSQYFLACKLSDVLHADYGDALKVTPYWITLDGTKVPGDTVIKTVNEAYTASTESVTVSQEHATISCDTADSCYAQGGCTDGTYYYQAFVYQAGGSEADDDAKDRVYIVKYDMANGNEIATSDNLNLHHTNDITFNKDLSYTGDEAMSGLLVICHNSPYRDRVSFVDPDTLAIVNPKDITDANGTAIREGDYVLEVAADHIRLGTEETEYWLGFIPIGTKEVPLNLFSIEYNATHKQYVVGIAGGNQTYRILSADFSDAYGKAFNPIDEDIKAFTTQGVAADDKYIYFVLFNGKDSSGANITYDGHTGHVIAVYDWDGNKVNVIKIATTNGIGLATEPENISVHNNIFYIGTKDGSTKNSSRLYQLDKKGWTIVVDENEAYIGDDEESGEKYKTLEDAVEAVKAGETITIMAKTVEVSELMKITAKNVTITNKDGVNVTIKRSADYNGSLIENSGSLTIKSNETGSLKFDGGAYRGETYISNTADGTLNLTNIKMENILANTAGGAINSKGAVNITKCEFNDIESYSNGGAINLASGIATIANSKFDGNITDGRAGALYVANGAEVTSLEDSTFMNNSSGTGGGAIFNTGTLKMANTEFNSNHAGSVGGAINCDAGTMTATDCKFVSNDAKGNGGAIQVANGSTATFDETTDGTGSFEGNIAGTWNITTDATTGAVVKEVVNEGAGGAIRVNNANLTVKGYTFDGNSATLAGGAVNIGKDTNVLESQEVKAIAFEKAEFTLNETATQGGAVYNDGRELNITTCVFGGTDIQTNTDGSSEEVSLGNTATGNANNTGNGGAIYHAKGTLTITGSDFIGNSAANENSKATSAGEGGAIMLPFAAINATITNSTFEKNESTTNGGAICNRAYTSDDKEDINLSITDCRFGRVVTTTDETTSTETTVSHGNIAQLNGGAIYNGNESVLELVGNKNTVVSPLFEGNEAKGSTGGGAICVGTGALNVDGYTFNANKATGNQGGAIRAGGDTDSTIKNSEFTFNTSKASGGAIYKNGEMTIEGSDFTENSAGSVAGAINSDAKDITIQNSNFSLNKSGANSANNAGAIQVNGGTATIEVTDSGNYKFYKNEATGKSGGAIFVVNGANLIVQKAENAEGTITFSENTAASGGAICVNRGTVDVTKIAFKNNQATNGGAIYVDGGSLTVKNDDETSTTTKHAGVLTASTCTFTGNTADSNGGAVYLSSYAADVTETTEAAGTSATLSGSEFRKNKAKGGNGGAVYTESIITAKDTYGLTVEDCTFGAEGDTEYASANTANANGKYGGAIYITKGNAKIADTKFWYNSACNGGGVGAQSASIVKITSEDKANNAFFEGNKATYVNSGGQGGAIRFWKTGEGTSITGYTFKSNIATGNGGAVQADQNTNLAVSTCVFNNNSTSADGGALQTWSGITVTGSEFYKNAAKNGGAISFGRLSESNTVKDCTFGGTDTTTGNLGNTATASGGAIYSAAQELKLIDDKELSVANLFEGNKATSTEEGATANGGAICVVEGVTNVTGYDFQNNEATSGGAVYVSGHTESGKDYAGTFEASTCEFTGNKATTSGGAVYLDSFTVGTSATLNESTFTKNEATGGNGGAVYSTSTKTTEGEEAAYGLNVTNCTFGVKGDTEYASANEATKSGAYGGAIYVTTGGQEITTKAQIKDTSFYYNHAYNGGAVGTNEEKGTCIVEFVTGDESEKAVFAGNQADNMGGAIRFWGVNSETSINGYTFISNIAEKNGGAITANESAIFDVNNCKFDTNITEKADGGAIYLASGSVATLTGNKVEGNISVFTGNKATNGNGGALATSGAGTYKIYNYTFTGNQALKGNGGAIYAQNTLEVQDTVFGTADKGNSAVNGGAIYSAGNATITDTTFGTTTTDADGKTVYVGNTASANGGAIYVAQKKVTLKSDDAANKPLIVGNEAIKGCAVYVYGGELSVTNYEFANHETTDNGGAIYLGEQLTEEGTDEAGNAVAATYSSGNLTATGTKFSNNKAHRGGAVYALAGTASIDSSEFSDNDATDRAGALYVEDNATVSKLDNSTLSKNTSGASGGAIFNAGTLNMKTTTFSENEAGSVAGAINCESGVMTAESCNFVSNTSVGNGGAVQVADKSDATFSGTGTFSNNTAGTWNYDESTEEKTTVAKSGAGGAIRTNNSLLSVTGYTFDGNSATTTGGAVDIGSGAATSADGTDTEAKDEVIKFNSSVFVSNNAEKSGGAIQNGPTNASGRDMTITGSKFGESEETGNNAGDLGGAIYHRAKTLNVSTTSFIGNKSASNGGAIYNAGVGTLKINGSNTTNEIFQKNTAEGSYGGGAIDIGTGTLEVTGYKFKDNKATVAGGGAIGIHTESIVTTITNSIFEGNEAVGDGGAIINRSKKTGVDALTIINCTFGGDDLGNKSTGGNGGAIYSSQGSVSITGTDDAAIFKGNSTSANNKSGGAICLSAGSLTVNKYTFDTNKAKQQGGAIWLNAGTSGLIENSKFNGNSTISASGGAIYKKGELTITKTDFTGNTAYSVAGAINSDAGDITIQNCNFNLNRSGINSDNTVRDGQNVGAIQVNGGKAIIEITDNENYTFSGNEASGNGGAIRVLNGSSLEIKKTDGVTGTLTFTGNKADNGGAIYIDNNASASSIKNATFNGNEATSGNGGALYTGVDVTITDTDFGATDAGNKATGNGGAIYLTNGKTVTLTKSETLTEKPAFTANSVTGEASVGGAIFTDTGVINATGYSFEGNTAPNGGAICVGEVTVTETPVVDENGAETGEVTTTTTTESGTLTATGCNFNGNIANSQGGACYIITESTATVTGSTFTKNVATAGNGGAIYTASTKLVEGEETAYGLTIEDCTFGKVSDTNNEYEYANTATAGNYYGGAIYVTKGNAKIVDTSFLYNQSKNGAAVGVQSAKIVKIIADDDASKALCEGNNTGNQGGAIRFAGTAAGTEISGYTFESNKATANGGAVQADQNTNLQVINCVFNNNHSDKNGGALQTWSSISVSGGTFYKNSAINGGAIGVDEDSLTVDDASFNENTSTSGGAIYFTSSSSAEITDTYFYMNSAGQGGAIYTLSNNLKIKSDDNPTNAVFEGNKATSAAGGAINFHQPGTGEALPIAQIEGYTFVLNTANTNGGAVRIEKAKVNISNCMFGGISTEDADGDGNLDSLGNEAKSQGGAIFSGNGSVTTITGTKGNAMSSFVSNSANLGGAIDVGSGTFTLTNYTFTGNTATTATTNGISLRGGTIKIGDCIFNAGPNQTVHDVNRISLPDGAGENIFDF